MRYYFFIEKSFGQFLLVMVVAVEWAHEPIILEELHSFSLLVDVVEN